MKQLSKAKPTKNRHNANSQKLSANTVATPAKNPVTLAPTNAGILPYLSAIHPKIRPPKIAPTKKMLWAVVGSALFSHTHPNCNGDLRSNNLLSDRHVQFRRVLATRWTKMPPPPRDGTRYGSLVTRILFIRDTFARHTSPEPLVASCNNVRLISTVKNRHARQRQREKLLEDSTEGRDVEATDSLCEPVSSVPIRAGAIMCAGLDECCLIICCRNRRLKVATKCVLMFARHSARQQRAHADCAAGENIWHIDSARARYQKPSFRLSPGTLITRRGGFTATNRSFPAVPRARSP